MPKLGNLQAQLHCAIALQVSELTSRMMEPAKGIEPLNYGLGIPQTPQILRKINNLALQGLDKSGKIHKPAATRNRADACFLDFSEIQYLQ